MISFSIKVMERITYASRINLFSIDDRVSFLQKGLSAAPGFIHPWPQLLPRLPILFGEILFKDDLLLFAHSGLPRQLPHFFLHRSRNKLYNDGSWHVVVHCTFYPQTVNGVNISAELVNRHRDHSRKDTYDFISGFLIFLLR